MPRWPAAMLALSMLATGAGSAEPAREPRAPVPLHLELRLEAEGNQLVVRQRAPVTYSSLDGLAAGLEQALPARASAFRLFRASPAELIEYVLCVTREGVLVVGQQTRTWDFAARRYVFARGEIERGYQPLERPGPWTWLLAVPLSRERSVTLELRADAGSWPVESVTIQPVLTR